MLLRCFFTPGLAVNTYLLYDEETKRGAVIDPTRDIEAYISRCLQDNIEITDIFETHVHADFISGARELKEALSNQPKIHCSGLGGSEWIPDYADHIVKDRDSVQLGKIRLEAWHTPGHTPEHLIWLAFDENRNPQIPEMAFTGDLLFVGSVGRPDLLGMDHLEQLIKQLYETLFTVLEPLPDFLEIYPSHGAGSVCGKEIGLRDTSTLGYERRSNPGMIHQEFQTWRKRLLKDMPSMPDYFPRMKRLNLKGVQADHGEIPAILTTEKLKEYLATCLIIDTRPQEAFAKNHLKQAINIPFAPAFPLWAGSIIPEDSSIVLVVENTSSSYPILKALRLIGIDSIQGLYSLENCQLQTEKEKYFVESPVMNVKEVFEKQRDHFILDVRSPTEWRLGHITGAHHIELARLPQVLKQIPHDQPIAVFCHSGNRASVAASLLVKERGLNAKNVKGGMQAWINEGFPVVKELL